MPSMGGGGRSGGDDTSGGASKGNGGMGSSGSGGESYSGKSSNRSDYGPTKSGGNLADSWGGGDSSYREGPERTGPNGTTQSWTAMDGWHDVSTRAGVPSYYGGRGLMATAWGARHPDQYRDERAAFREAQRQGALSGWNDISRAGILERMKDLPHAQMDAYLSAFDHAQFDQIPDEYMSAAHIKEAQGYLDALNGPIASALNLTQTPYEAINSLARDLTFSDVEKGEDFTDGGAMGLKPSSVYSKILGSDLYSAPLGAAAMATGGMVNGIAGKITSALGQGLMTPGPTSALGWMKNTLDLAQKAHVAGVKTPERNTFTGVENGGALRLPDSVQTVATRSPAYSNSSSSMNLSRSNLQSIYGAYGYTLI